MAKRGPRTAVAPTDGTHRQIRCAIYTRKSTEEGLDQDFNSLDAQREACAAFIVSQKHEGWIGLPALYDDGGFSGGSLERPALWRLLADVEAGRVDVIVVYKVDRLTRALSDFAKIVEILDARGASFVSVTQAFNTTTSMGRLTLNVLLSFAQFEREVTGERIRDKIAASKKKGMWMGGPVPLGYDVVERKLIVNEVEAETVRLIFERHRAMGTLSALADDLANRDVRSKRRLMRDGRVVGDKPYTAGALTYVLRNRLYVGQVRHGDQIYPGEHLAILDHEIWDASQQLLDRSAPRPRTGQLSILAGMLVDDAGQAMAPVHAIRGTKRYRYYASRNTNGHADRSWRLPAGDLEATVQQAAQHLLRDPLRLAAELDRMVLSPTIVARAEHWAERIDTPAALRELLHQAGARIIIAADAIRVRLNRERLAAALDDPGASPDDDAICEILLPAILKRRGHELRLIHRAPDARPAVRDAKLIKLLASGRAAYAALLAGEGAASATRRSHLTRLSRLAFLAPDIVVAILDGRQPAELTSRSLLRVPELPLAWHEQRELLGFA